MGSWLTAMCAAVFAASICGTEPASQIGGGQTVDKAVSEATERRKEEREQSDLDAQWVMAHAGIGMAVFTFIQLAIGGFTLWFLYKTFRENRRTAKAALLAARAAHASNRQSRLTAERQLRAYVMVESCQRTRRSEGDTWVVELKIKNFGATPAYASITCVDYAIVKKMEAETFSPPNPTRLGSKADVGPGDTHTLRIELPEFDHPSKWAAFKDHQLYLYFWGRLDFVDAFGSSRWITFRLGQDGGHVRNLRHAKEGNQSSETPRL